MNQAVCQALRTPKTCSLSSHFSWSWIDDYNGFNSLYPSEMNEMGTQKTEILSLSKDKDEGQRKLPKGGDTTLRLEEEKHVSMARETAGQDKSKCKKHSLLGYGK